MCSILMAGAWSRERCLTSRLRGIPTTPSRSMSIWNLASTMFESGGDQWEVERWTKQRTSETYAHTSSGTIYIWCLQMLGIFNPSFNMSVITCHHNISKSWLRISRNTFLSKQVILQTSYVEFFIATLQSVWATLALNQKKIWIGWRSPIPSPDGYQDHVQVCMT